MSRLLDSVSTTHPRLLGPADFLRRLRDERPVDYQRTVKIARHLKTGASHDDHAMRGRLMAMNLVSAIEHDTALAAEATAIVQHTFLDKPVRVGHVSFGVDCGQVAMNFDLCRAQWTDARRDQFSAYLKEAREKNIGEETSVFHNGWYGMKTAGFVLSCLALKHEHPYADELFEQMEEEYRTRAAPGLNIAGAGGGFCEGYYTQFWIHDWIVALHCLKTAAGIDWFALAPDFHRQRAIAGMFELFPGFSTNGSRRAVACGDSGGRHLHPEREKSLTSMRILAGNYPKDPAHHAVLTYTDQVPQSSFNFGAYRDFLWKQPALPRADLNAFKLSHHSAGPGNVHSRSSWEEDSSYLFFRCGRRFTTHQHLDQAHFVLYKYEEMLGDGGEYCGWGDPHIINYYIRSIAHNTLLVHDPAEQFPKGIRGGGPAANDGGQAVRWIGTPWLPGGDGFDLKQWNEYKQIGDTGQILVYEDPGPYMYCAGDATRAYSDQKLALFTRQIVHLRPDTFVIFDRVRSTRPEFKKSILLHTMARPGMVEDKPDRWSVCNGYGRMFVQFLLPATLEVRMFRGEAMYRYDGQSCPPTFNLGDGPDTRMEISPAEPALEDYFLQVFQLGDYNVYTPPPPARCTETGDAITVNLPDHAKVTFTRKTLSCIVEPAGRSQSFSS